MYRWPRGPIHQTPMGREGPDQFWEQVFEAFEEKPPGLVRETFSKQTSGWDMFSVPRQKLGMNDDIEKFNPGMQKLDLYFRYVPIASRRIVRHICMQDIVLHTLPALL